MVRESSGVPRVPMSQPESGFFDLCDILWCLPASNLASHDPRRVNFLYSHSFNFPFGWNIAPRRLGGGFVVGNLWVDCLLKPLEAPPGSYAWHFMSLFITLWPAKPLSTWELWCESDPISNFFSPSIFRHCGNKPSAGLMPALDQQASSSFQEKRGTCSPIKIPRTERPITRSLKKSNKLWTRISQQRRVGEPVIMIPVTELLATTVNRSRKNHFWVTNESVQEKEQLYLFTSVLGHHQVDGRRSVRYGLMENLYAPYPPISWQ